MVLRNVAKTFSLEEQRQEINEIAVDLDAVNTTLTNWNASQWDTAYGWGDHALAGYLVATTTDKTNWNTAFAWGDHASAGYLTAYQTDAQIKTSYEANADTNAFTDAFQTKLNGIETGATADQTAAEIRTLVGSASDSNVFTDAEKTKLSGIETGATADQTGAEIKTAYEGEADTNAFTDAEQTKLSGIEAGATVNAATGGTSGGLGTQADPQYGSVQFRGGTNTLLGDSLFVYETTNNKLSIGASSGSAALNVVRPGATSVDTAYFYASTNGADNRILINTIANQGGNPFIRFDSGGSNMVIGQLWAGTTNNKLVLGTGETPSGVTGIAIDGLGNVTANNLALDQTNTSATGASSTSTVLDHYEEGTWTPTPLGLSNSPTFSNLKGRFVRIGSLVQINGFIQMGSSPTWNNVNDFFMLGPLPFNYNTDNAGYFATAGSVTCQNFNFHDNDYSNTGQVNCGIANSSGVSYVVFLVSDNNNTRGTVKNSAISGTDIIEFSLTYRAG